MVGDPVGQASQLPEVSKLFKVSLHQPLAGEDLVNVSHSSCHQQEEGIGINDARLTLTCRHSPQLMLCQISLASRILGEHCL